MKKLILFFIFISLSSFLFSQSMNLNSAVSYLKDYTDYNEGITSLQKAKDNIEIASKGDGTKDKAKTWYYRGLIFQTYFELGLKNEMSKSQEKDMTKKYSSAYQTVSVADLDEAVISFKKSIELDSKKDYEKECKTRISNISNNYYNKADAFYSAKNYSDAGVYYEKAYELKNSLNISDTSSIYNVAISSIKSQNYKKAEQFFTKLIELKYKADKPEKFYVAIIHMYKDAKDTSATRIAIQTARKALPENAEIMALEIDLYSIAMDNTEDPIKRKELAQKAINALNSGIATNPKNHEFYLVLGNTYNKMAFPKSKTESASKPSNYDELVKKAEENYLKSIELKPDYFLGHYLLGVCYYNQAMNIQKEADTIKDKKKLDEADKKTDVLLQKGILCLEKANQIDPTDKDAMKSLMILYARTGQGDSDKYKKINELYKK